MGIEIKDLGIGIKDLGFRMVVFGLEIRDYDWRLRLVIGIGDWGLELGIRN